MSNTALDDFLGTVSDTTEMNTERAICPEIDVTGATIEAVDMKSGVIKSGDREGQPWFGMSLRWNIDNEDAREVMGRDQVIVFGDMIFLTVGDDNQLSKKDNPDLATLMQTLEIEAEGLTNQELFDSFIGQYAQVAVGHREYNNKISAQVTKVAAA